MRALVFLAFAWCCAGQVLLPYKHPYNAIPFPLAVKYHATDAFGQTTFGHEALDQTRHEVRLADGRVIGQYSYIDPNGEPAITYYEAGPNGYRVIGSNILPEAPTADLAAPVNDLIAPEPVGYTPEVAAARAEFAKIFAEAATAAEATPDTPQLKTSLPAEPAAAAEPAIAEPEPAVDASAAPLAVEAEEASPAVPEAEPTFAANDAPAAETVEEPAVEEPAAEEEVSRKKRQIIYNAPGTIGQTFIRPLTAVKIDGDDNDAAQPLYYTHPWGPLAYRTLAHPAMYTGMPLVFTTPKVETATAIRNRREVRRIPLPYLHAVPTETETKVETKQFEPVEAATPADTAKIELTTKEHVFKVPGIKYVQPVMEVKPVKYTAPQVLPYQTALPFHPYAFPGAFPGAYPGLPYHGLLSPVSLNPAAKEE